MAHLEWEYNEKDEIWTAEDSKTNEVYSKVFWEDPPAVGDQPAWVAHVVSELEESGWLDIGGYSSADEAIDDVEAAYRGKFSLDWRNSGLVTSESKS